MANRRMFAKSVTGSSKFLLMPHKIQALYYQLGMNVDDDGYVEYVPVMRTMELRQADVNHLSTKGFVEVYEDGIAKLLHHDTNNKIRKDRYAASVYKNKKLQTLNSNGNAKDNQKSTKRPHSIGKVRLGKERKESKKEKDALASQAISLFNEISNSKRDIKNSTHIKNCVKIITELRRSGVKEEYEILDKFRFVFTNQKKIADDESNFWDHYKLPTLIGTTKFFEYLDADEYGGKTGSLKNLHPCQVAEMNIKPKKDIRKYATPCIVDIDKAKEAEAKAAILKGK